MLFISGGGHAKDTKKLDEAFVQKTIEGRILYIPIGLKKSFIGYEECFDWFQKTINALTESSLNLEMWVNLKDKDKEDLKRFSGIYIGGGRNSYELMDEFRNTGFAASLRDYHKQKGHVYGGSTGAIILGSNVAVFGEEKPYPSVSEEGLSLIGKFSVFCHYSQEREKKLKDFLANHKIPVIALPETSGVVVDNMEMKVLGFAPARIFTSYKDKFTISPGDIIKLRDLC